MRAAIEDHPSPVEVRLEEPQIRRDTGLLPRYLDSVDMAGSGVDILPDRPETEVHVRPRTGIPIGCDAAVFLPPRRYAAGTGREGVALDERAGFRLHAAGG